ncbi:MAG: hypothetical protein HY852_14950 [Bradyrhizobium sp.]|uniref:hypothetical protein n=1 Tax=Bradyrhizobium sp. TaxID=376 RepID=UPI0025C544A2|nr:hypothetical protein [Bradyrhizobium sp.]MBI5263107.1 hypothetical protein [Bradyrhizobium sp.]
MTIRRMLEGSGLEQARVEHVKQAYQQVLHHLQLLNQSNAVTEMIARKVIEIGKNGGDPGDIAQITLKELLD